MSVIFINPYRFTVAAASYDADAQDYINRVIAADVAAGNSSGLEVGVQDAINALFVGCKADGNFSDLGASCILAAARTLSGALVPVVGTAPTNSGFDNADYDRKTGLKGNGTNFLLSNRLANVDSDTDIHAAVYITEADSRTTSIGHLGSGNAGGHVNMTSSSTARGSHLRTASFTVDVPNGKAAGFFSCARSASGVVRTRTNGANYTSSALTGTARTGNIRIFSNTSTTTDARMSFYSLGSDINQESLEARLITFTNAIAAAIS